MVALDVVRSCNATLVKTHPLVAVFVGGTAGIGEYSVRALAATHGKDGKGLRLYIVGRNASAAEKIINGCTQDCPAGQFQFIKADNLSLLKDVDRCCDEIIKAERNAKSDGGPPRVDLLVCSQGVISFAPRKDTPEGLDEVHSLIFYSRMRFAYQLLPLLTASPLSGRVVSVLNPNVEGKVLYPADLSVRDPKHFGFSAFSQIAYQTLFFMEALAQRHPGKLSLSHYYPGFVTTDIIKNSPLPGWVKFAGWLLTPITNLKAVPHEECGQRILFLASSMYQPQGDGFSKQNDDVKERAVAANGVVGGGAYRVNWNDDIIPNKKQQVEFRDQGMVEKVWKHTITAFEEIESGKTFAG